MNVQKKHWDLDKRTLLMEGLTLHVGLREALDCHTTFQQKYIAKHGTCLEYVIASGNNPVAQREYKLKEDKAFERYALMWAHYRVKQRVY